MNRKFVASLALATAVAVPSSGLGVTAAAATPSKPSTASRSIDAKAAVAELKSPHRRGTKKHSQWYAKQYMQVRYGWGESQQAAIINLWMKESGWNHKSSNGSSGAYGIPQSLPGGKMASHGKDWRTNPETQIRWGLSYIKGRYGSPNKAWSHFRSHNWY